MGDFNYPGIDWNSLTSSASPQEQLFLEEYQDWFLWQHTTRPTRFRGQQTANILVLVMTNEEGMINDITDGDPIGMSDHVTLSWTLNCYAQVTASKVRKYMYNNGNYIGMRADLAMEDWDCLLENKSTEEQWSVISSRISEVLNRYIPSKVYGGSEERHKRPKWMNSRVLAKRKRKREMFEDYQRTREGRDYIQYTKARNAARAETRRAVREYEREVAKLAKRNLKAFFRHVNSKLKTKNKIADLRTGDNITGDNITDDNKKEA